MILDLLIGLPLASERARSPCRHSLHYSSPSFLHAYSARYQSFSVERASPSAFELHGPLPPPIFLASKVIQSALEGEGIPVMANMPFGMAPLQILTDSTSPIGSSSKFSVMRM